MVLREHCILTISYFFPHSNLRSVKKPGKKAEKFTDVLFLGEKGIWHTVGLWLRTLQDFWIWFNHSFSRNLKVIIQV